MGQRVVGRQFWTGHIGYGSGLMTRWPDSHKRVFSFRCPIRQWMMMQLKGYSRVWGRVSIIDNLDALIFVTSVMTNFFVAKVHEKFSLPGGHRSPGLLVSCSAGYMDALFHDNSSVLIRAILCINTAYAVSVRLSVCLSVSVSVTFVYSVETNKQLPSFLSVSLYFSKRGAYWDRLWRRWSLVGCHARALWPNGAS